MRGLCLLLVGLMCLGLVGCGASHQSFSVQQVKHAFAEHGLPVTEGTPAASLFGLPPAKEHALDRQVRAVLGATNPRTFSTRLVYVFDSAASLQHARQLAPGMLADRKGSRTVKGNSTSESGCAMHRKNVFALGSYQYCKRMRLILAGLG